MTASKTKSSVVVTTREEEMKEATVQGQPALRARREGPLESRVWT